jgi:hypothetical protein
MTYPRSVRRIFARFWPVGSVRAGFFCSSLLLTATLAPLLVTHVVVSAPLLLTGDDTKTGGGPG